MPILEVAHVKKISVDALVDLSMVLRKRRKNDRRGGRHAGAEAGPIRRVEIYSLAHIVHLGQRLG
jgi:hypothetical protein